MNRTSDLADFYGAGASAPVVSTRGAAATGPGRRTAGPQLFLGLAVSLLVGLVLCGCTVSDQTLDLTRDMSMTVNTSQLPDLNGLDLSLVPGSIGAPCTLNSDCKTGTAKCWAQNLLDDPGNLPTPGGYCTSTCAADADCAGQGTCQTIGNGLKYCLASCFAANICRSQQRYACFILGPSKGYCYPSNRLACNPTQIDPATGNGTCPGATQQAACIRRAYEDLGECLDTCTIGSGTCPAVGNTLQHCVYVDQGYDAKGQPTRDKFKGAACFPLSASPKQLGDTCAYADQCADGLECNLGPSGDKKCHALCVVGAPGTCGAGQTCADSFSAGRGNPGLCF